MKKVVTPGIDFGNVESVARGPCPEENLFSLNRLDDPRFFMQRVMELLERVPFGCRVAWEEIPHLRDSSIPALSALYHQWSQGAQGRDAYISDYFEHAWDLASANFDGKSTFSSMVVCPAKTPSSAPLMTLYVDISPWRDGDEIFGVNIVFKHCVLSQNQNDWAQHFFAGWATQRDVEQKPYHLSSITSEEEYARALRVPAIRAVLERIREQAFDFVVNCLADFSGFQYRALDGVQGSSHCPSLNNTALIANLRGYLPDFGSALVCLSNIASIPEDGRSTTDAIYTGFTSPPVESFEGMTRMTTLCAPDHTGDFFGFRRVKVNSDHAMAGNIYGPQGDPLLYLALPFSCDGALR